MSLWRNARHSDMARLVSWIDSPDSLARWAGPEPDWPLSADRLWHEIEVEQLLSHSLVEGDTLLAFGQLRPREAGNWRLCRLIVAPDQRGKKLGERLCRHLIAEARQRDAARITLGVFGDNLPAISLYRRLGFIDDGPEDDRGVRPMVLGT